MTPLIRGLEAVSSIVIVLIIAPDVARRRPPAFTLGKICPWPANPPPGPGKVLRTVEASSAASIFASPDS